MECAVIFSYEYDDFFRISSIAASFDSYSLPVLRFEYDARYGRLAKMENFAYLRDGRTRRLLGESVIYFGLIFFSFFLQ